MTKKLKWTVGEAPTGLYRSFFKRSWPTAQIDGRMAISLSCDDDYIPANVKTGKHAEIAIRVADYREGRSFTWRTLKARAATLAEAKEISQRFVDNNPTFFGLPA